MISQHIYIKKHQHGSERSDLCTWSYPETTSSPSEEKAHDRTGADWLVRVWSSFMVQAAQK